MRSCNFTFCSPTQIYSACLAISPHFGNTAQVCHCNCKTGRYSITSSFYLDANLIHSSYCPPLPPPLVAYLWEDDQLSLNQERNDRWHATTPSGGTPSGYSFWFFFSLCKSSREEWQVACHHTFWWHTKCFPFWIFHSLCKSPTLLRVFADGFTGSCRL